MVYKFNPHRHIKIWLSSSPDTFLNLKNKLRLVEMRKTNLHDEIYFIYDSQLLSESALEQLAVFCKKYEFKAQDVRELFKECQTPLEQKLIIAYDDEVQNLDKGGNLGAASDILRWIKPVYKLGVYADFDVNINTKNLPASITVRAPILLNFGSVTRSGEEILLLNNDVLAVVDYDAAQSMVEQIQKEIADNSLLEISTSHSPFMNLITRAGADPLKPASQEGKMAIKAHFLGVGKKPREIRNKILEISKDNLSYCNEAFHHFTEQNKVVAVANTIRVMSNRQSWFKQLFRNKFWVEARQETDEELVSRMRETWRFNLLQLTVTSVTGPAAVCFAAFHHVKVTSQHAENALQQFSFAEYELQNAFISPENYHFYMENEPSRENVKNDYSWLDAGKKRMAKSEEEIIQNQKKLLDNLAKSQQLIDSCIVQVQSGMSGLFGFYCYNWRCKQLELLQEIKSCFENSHFNAAAFHVKRDPYDLSCFADTETKSVIDELTQLVQKAELAALDDENGKIELPEESISPRYKSAN